MEIGVLKEYEGSTSELAASVGAVGVKNNGFFKFMCEVARNYDGSNVHQM